MEVLLFFCLLVFIMIFVCLISNSRIKGKQVKDIDKEWEKISYMTGLEFEHYCAKLLSENGFTSVKVTQGSGDYGADILATYHGERYAVQCKKYTDHVGIKAVQEISSARQYYKTDKAAVITNTYFTKAAISLAEETNVLLWDRGFLENIILNRKPGSQYTISPLDNDSNAQAIRQDDCKKANLEPQAQQNEISRSPTYEVKKNELPQGKYLIGKDIPAGSYDFTLVWGTGGSLLLSVNGETNIGSLEFYEHLGTKYEYEKIFCLNVNCSEGRYLIVQGNIAVKIAKSKPLQIDLD